MPKFLAAVAVLTAGLAAGLAQEPAPSRTVLDGVYTTEQADRGHAAYETYCVGCHEGLEADGPELTVKAFLDRWREARLEPLFTFMKTTMPGNTPGSLEDRVYADIIAFILEAHGLPAGDRELTAGMVGSIQLVGLDGPRPLANLTIVRAVGCLNSEPGNTWALVKAGRMTPVRSRIVAGTTPEELKESSALPLGSALYPLMSVTDKAASLKGHKVQVKGVLTRQKEIDRINVMSLDSVGPACGT